MALPAGPAPGSRKFTSSMGRLELADYLCVDRSALTRELGRMQEEGLIVVNKMNLSC